MNLSHSLQNRRLLTCMMAGRLYSKNHANNEEQALRNLVNKLSQEFENVLNAKSDYAKMFPEDTVTA